MTDAVKNAVLSLAEVYQEFTGRHAKDEANDGPFVAFVREFFDFIDQHISR